MEEEYEILYEEDFSAQRPDPPPSPLSPEEAEERERRIKKKDDHFKAAASEQSGAQCFRCESRRATVALVHEAQESETLPTYHFVFCLPCHRFLRLQVEECPKCRKRFSFSKKLADAN